MDAVDGDGLAAAFVTEPSPPKRAARRGEPGRWLRAGVLDAGKAGVLLGGWGVW